jgi:predicted CXXCH cytochrome family protein
MKLKPYSKVLSTCAVVLCACFSLAGIQSGKALAAGETPAAAESCVTAKCHSTMGKSKFVHGPVAQGECTTCHVLAGKHKFKPIADVGKMCTECHEKPTTMAFVHPPVKQGKCTKCHDPHQSPNKFQLRAEGAELCYMCHNKAMASGKFVHGPVAVGGCAACHSAHQSSFPKLLMAKGNDVCFSCHSDKAELFKSKKFSHAPVKAACVSCHSPHSSDFKFTLKAEGTEELCYTCHKDKQKDVASAKVKHKGIATDRKCLACHDVHVSDHPKQLVKGPAELCLGCHDRTYNSADGKRLNIKEVLATNSSHHGPVKDCSGCHNAHGSNNFRILRENFPPLFYAGYNPENYKLCFMCHEKSLASEKSTTTLTSFRNGDQNLHFVHVNKAVKGRTCRACHDAHATNNKKHIRDAIPFGAWKLPVGYTKTDTGGKCLPGCHKLYSYDRTKAVKNL